MTITDGISEAYFLRIPLTELLQRFIGSKFNRPVMRKLYLAKHIAIFITNCYCLTICDIMTVYRGDAQGITIDIGIICKKIRYRNG